MRLIFSTALCLLAFAGNSLLCRYGLEHGGIDAASFTALRLASGALALGGLVLCRFAWRGPSLLDSQGDWLSALALFVYAAGFSFAYLQLGAATGALLLFAAVQVTMIGRGLWLGERLDAFQTVGLLVAVAGVIVLLLPGVAVPGWQGALLMAAAGVAWGVYSLRGRRALDPLAATAGNFVRTVPMVLSLWLLLRWLAPAPGMSAALAAQWALPGVAAALVSGVLASGMGYALWYRVLPSLPATHAATVQLAVPVVTALGAFAWLGEIPGITAALAMLAVLGGIMLVSWPRRTRA